LNTAKSGINKRGVHIQNTKLVKKVGKKKKEFAQGKKEKGLEEKNRVCLQLKKRARGLYL